MRFAKGMLIVFLLCLLVCPALAEDSENLLVNGSFETLNGQGLPSGWYTDAYVHQEGYTLFSVSEDARTGERSASIENFGDNDARFAQQVAVEPDSLYCLSGYVKVLGMTDYGRGANLSIDGLYIFSDSLYDVTDDWVYLELYGRTGSDQTDVTIFARVGGYSGESIGRALFDDLSLRKVDVVPGDGLAASWSRVTTQQSVVVNEEEREASPFWPWLIVISVCYLILGAVMLGWCLYRKPNKLRKVKGAPVLLILGLTVAAVARLVVAWVVEGYQVDVNCFVSWGSTMARVGPVDFYQTVNFCDYTPAYIYLMGFNHAVLRPVAGWLAGLFGASAPGYFAHKLIPIACDIAMAYMVYLFARRRDRLDRLQAQVVGLLFALNPAMALNSAGWCQIDSVLCLCLMLVAWLAVERKWAAVLPVYVLAALIKPQALMLGPLGLIAIVTDQVLEIKKSGKKPTVATFRPLLIGLGISVAVAAVIILPFCFRQERWTWLFDLYGKTLASYPYATVNTANLYYLLDANWVGINAICSWQGMAVFAAVAAGWGAWLAYRQRKLRLGWLEPVALFVFAGVFLMMLVANLSVRGVDVWRHPGLLAVELCVLFAVGCVLIYRWRTAHRGAMEAALLAGFIGMCLTMMVFNVVRPVAITWVELGTVAMVMSFVVVLGCYIRSGKLECLPLCGAVLFILMYVLGIKMHERYLFPALILLAMAFAVHRDVNVFILLILTSCTMLVNEGIVLDNSIRLGSANGHLTASTLALNDLTALFNVAMALLAVPTCHRLCVRGEPVELKLPHQAEPPHAPSGWRASDKLSWKRLDWVLMLSVTLIYSVVTLTTLGSTKAPQHPWKSTTYDEAVIIDLGHHYDDVSMLYFCQVTREDFSVAVSEDGETWSEEYWAEMREGQCFRWKYLAPCYGTYDKDGRLLYADPRNTDGAQKLSGRYVRITAQQIGLVLNEVIFRDAQGQAIPATVLRAENANPASPNFSDPAAVLDEQGTLSGEPSWWNGTYFDEIYHARTAFEHLNGTQPYETSHPPLGKVIMSWFVGIFGMTPFGWRFAGALAGILMLPAMYVLGKQMTGRTSIGFAAMAMIALDCMHFTQTRIATIDSFPVLFIILSWLFMLRFMQRDIIAEPIKKVLPDLAWSGFFMGCGIASKWIGIYSGAGLALVYFWTCVRHVRRKGIDGFRRAFFLCLWCLLFFVAVPLAIYLLSYVPYFAYVHIESLGDFLNRVYRANFDPISGMFAYHSRPGLGMDHPFYSPWYEWPLIKRPMYYASPSFVPAGWSYAIFCFGNPAVWLVGLAGIAMTAGVWAKRHVYTVKGSSSGLHWWSASWSVLPAFVLVGLLAQYLPWVLVPRGTYIYHYFASVPFLILGTCLMLHWLQERWPLIGRAVIIAYLIVCLVFFIAYFPYASGLLTPVKWLDYMKQFLRVYY